MTDCLCLCLYATVLLQQTSVGVGRCSVLASVLEPNAILTTSQWKSLLKQVMHAASGSDNNKTSILQEPDRLVDDAAHTSTAAGVRCM